MKGRAGIACVLAAVLVASAALAGGFEDLESEVKEYTLPNGLTFIVLERHDAPVFTYRTYVDAGGADEVPGNSGTAHMFEHMAFKGTETVGVSDYEAEKEAMQREDEAMTALIAERNKGRDADSNRLGQLETTFKEAESAAKEYVVSNEFSKILSAHGMVGLNAQTGLDFTRYYYSLPSNRLELWARLEGDRMTNPVLREFYAERDVVYEERRFAESSPTGRLVLDWIRAAFLAHPYGTTGGVIGNASDLKSITRADAREFFDKYYVGSNMAVAVVGDVKFDEVKRLADKYFSGVRTGPDPPPLRTVEPRHDYEIRLTREEDAQPFVLVGYHVPGGGDPDWPAVQLLGNIIGSGRSSRLYKRLVKEDKIAAQAGASASFLANKYPTLLVVQALVAKDATADQVEAAIYEELERLADEGPTAEELDKVKTRAKASFIRTLRSNDGLAEQLAEHQTMWGDWRMLFSYLDNLAAVSVADIQRVAAEALRPGNRVVGIITKPAEAASAESE